MSNNGLTGCTEHIRGFLGHKPKYKLCDNGREAAIFDLSFGVNNPQINKYAGWRHCLAYGELAKNILNLEKGQLMIVDGWMAVNPVFGPDGKKKVNDQGRDITKEWVIVQYATVKEQSQDGKQLSLVGGGSKGGNGSGIIDQDPASSDDFPF